MKRVRAKIVRPVAAVEAEVAIAEVAVAVVVAVAAMVVAAEAVEVVAATAVAAVAVGVGVTVVAAEIAATGNFAAAQPARQKFFSAVRSLRAALHFCPGLRS